MFRCYIHQGNQKVFFKEMSFEQLNPMEVGINQPRFFVTAGKWKDR